MSTTSDKLHKLKVTELKDLLAKHSLVQTGKKEDLIKRLLDNNVSPDDEPAGEEELTDPPAVGTEGASGEAYSAAPAPPPTTDEPFAASDIPVAPSSEPVLTPEQQAMKARAERFGVPFNPNPTPTTKPKAAPAASAPAAAATTDAKKSAGPIDKASLGIPDQTLAKRAARFGLPEKKADAPAPAAKPASASKPKSAAAELTPEQAAKNAEDEEKKRKRAEKFGAASAKPDSSAAEPDAKKAKV